MGNLTNEIRAILMASKTNDGIYFSEIVGHARIIAEDFETAEVAQIIFTGAVPNLDDSMDEELAPVWLHKYSFGWILGLDNGDQYAILN